MSAYDNPTIIKNDAALIWGQAAGGFATSFLESFNASRKEREANDKEANQQNINNQVFLSESQYKNKIKAAEVGSGLTEKGADAGAVDLYNKYELTTGDVKAENDLSLHKTVLSKEERQAKDLYSSQRSAGSQNLTNTIGGMFSQSGAFKDNKINSTNINNIRFDGNNILDQAIHRATTLGNAFFDPAKTTRDLVYDVKGDPSKITLLITNNIGKKEDVIKFLEATNPGIKPPDGKTKEVFLEEEFNKGLAAKTGYGIVESKNKPGEYEFRFERPIDKDWDGTLYSEIPQIEYGKASVTAGVYAKDGETKINTKYIGPLTFETIENNAGLNKAKGSVMYERQKVNLDTAMLDMKPTIIATAEGLVATSLSDPNVADGVLAQLGFGTNYPSREWAGKSNKEKVDKLVEVMMEKEKQNIIEKSQLKVITDAKGIEGYYIQNEKENQIFSNPSTNKGNTNDGNSGNNGKKKPEDTQLYTQEEKNRIYNSGGNTVAIINNHKRDVEVVKLKNGKYRLKDSVKNTIIKDSVDLNYLRDALNRVMGKTEE